MFAIAPALQCCSMYPFAPSESILRQLRLFRETKTDHQAVSEGKVR